MAIRMPVIETALRRRFQLWWPQNAVAVEKAVSECLMHIRQAAYEDIPAERRQAKSDYMRGYYAKRRSSGVDDVTRQ